jgi:hypothetical protein
MKKNLFILVIITLFNTMANAQIMSLHLLKYEKSINPLFSKKSKSILVTFDKNSLIDSPQVYNYLFKVDISDRKSELIGVANDFNISGAVTAINRYGILGGVLASSFNTSKQFSYRNTNGYVILDRPSFDSLINFSEKLIKIIDSIKPPQNFSKSYFYKIDKLELSLEIQQSIETYNNANGESLRFKLDKTIFLKIDESVYVFSEEEFKELYNVTLLSTQSLWD